jgi:hypothetical protein
MQARLEDLREHAERLRRINFQDPEGRALIAKAEEEIKALEDALITDSNPKVAVALAWLKLQHPDIPFRYSGNEHWVMADTLPDDHFGKRPEQFAIWRTTGRVYRCIQGEVQDPEIYDPMEV